MNLTKVHLTVQHVIVWVLQHWCTTKGTHDTTILVLYLGTEDDTLGILGRTKSLPLGTGDPMTFAATGTALLEFI